MDNNNQFDEFKLDNGFVIEEDKKYDPKKSTHKKGKSKSIIKTTVWIVSIIIVSVAIAFGAIYAGADYLGIGFGRGNNLCTIEIKEGSSTEEIAKELQKTGAVKIPLLFRAYSKLKHYDGKFKYGVYSFNSESGYESLATMLMTEGAKAKSVSVTIPEGSNVDDIAKLLQEKGVCEKSDFYDDVQDGDFSYDFVNSIPESTVYYRLEGYLYPETYDFYCFDSKECAFLAVDKMLSTLNEKLKKANIDTKGMKIGEKDYTLHEILTMSSIVEMEAGGEKDEMANVAAVFYNRLKSADFDTLGSSPTRKYPYGNGKYDTYQCKGLPVGPLCSAGISSIKASCNPTENFDYYYFVTDASMKFYYNKTLYQHNNTIAKLKAEKNWIYEE